MEDPGAANMVLGLVGELTARGVTCKLLASDYAATHLESKKEIFEEVGGNPISILKKFDPQVVVVGSSEDRNSVSIQITEVCKKKNIKTIGLVDMACNAENRFMGNSLDPLQYAPENLIVTDKYTAKQYENLGYIGEIFEAIHPAYENAIKKNESNKNIDRVRKKFYLWPRAGVCLISKGPRKLLNTHFMDVAGVFGERILFWRN